ncbi:MAG TPA: hypothetical protein VN881_07845 [Candidatus Acidoferrales bacterium]|jgi:hypothetical protein|nr:hypothetical protein [Candidatus Acidoferrales bacterium]
MFGEFQGMQAAEEVLRIGTFTGAVILFVGVMGNDISFLKFEEID